MGADLTVSVGAAGQVVTVYALGVVIGGPVVAALTARAPRKGLALGLMLLFAAGSAISAVAPSCELLLVGRLISSFSHAAFLALALVLISAPPPARPSAASSSRRAPCAGPARRVRC